MLCPKCKLANLYQKDDIFLCSNKHCNHVELEPMTYEFQFPSSKDDDEKPLQFHLSAYQSAEEITTE